MSERQVTALLPVPVLERVRRPNPAPVQSLWVTGAVSSEIPGGKRRAETGCETDILNCRGCFDA